MIDENNVREAVEIPVVALRGLTVFPNMIIHFDLNRKISKDAVRVAMNRDQKIFMVSQKDTEIEAPKKDDLYEIGTIGEIKQVTKLSNQITRVLVEGQSRGRMLNIHPEKRYLSGDVEVFENDTETDETKEAAMLRMIMELVTEYASYHTKIVQVLRSQITDELSLSQIMDKLAMNLALSQDKKQKILEAIEVEERYEVLSTILYEEIEISKQKKKLAGEIKERIEKNQREYILHEQMSYIKSELGKEDNTESDQEQFERQLALLNASEEIKAKIQKEINRLGRLLDTSSESALERGYIETLLELPWDTVTKDNMDLTHAADVLDTNHYGMEKVKERVLEYLAVRAMTNHARSPILCLVGPPGTGKTSIAKSIAMALDKKYLRVCLGGVRDEAEIRGHRRTYVGAMPGRIASGLRQAGVKNPLMLLDEIDKVSNDYKGDTFSALLEVLDPDQNKAFRDHYVELPMDLSEVLFIATANSVANIPRPLLDRMELIEVSGYTENEKFHIAKKHLMKKQFVENGMTSKMLNISDKAIREVISSYTREAGVRELERKLGEICRKAAREIMQQMTLENDDNTQVQKIKITGTNIEQYLGKKKYTLQMANKKDEVGIVRGLAWTAVGGDTLQIEVNMMPGKGEIELTGQMGDVMKESARIGMSYIRMQASKYGIKAEVFKKHDFHIHIPEGAVPKDGPSAGITMATALLSAITGTKVYCRLAMTGEITLRGKVLPIGGLKEKLLAAKMAGITKVVVPIDNKRDIEELSGEITDCLEIVYVSDMNEVIENAFVKK